jgi:hypothetical protein
VMTARPIAWTWSYIRAVRVLVTHISDNRGIDLYQNVNVEAEASDGSDEA